MSTAINREATKIWVVNVGDLKPLEMHTEFFITYGYDAPKWNRTNLNSYVTSWAQREFGLSSADAAEVATILHNVTRHNARRKPELWNSTTYSLVNYRECVSRCLVLRTAVKSDACGCVRADNVIAMLQAASDASTRIYNALPSETKPAFFQLVHHPVQATFTLQNMYISAGLNNLRASQAFLSANNLKAEVESLFDQDHDLEVDYHTMLNGAWSSFIIRAER